MKTHMPRLRLLPESQLGEDSYHSILISALRGLAALQVAAAHLRAEFFPGLRSLENPMLWYQALSFFTGFAHQAVLVFFLISGYLVGGTSPFVTRRAMPVYVESSILALPKIAINGGRRGYLVGLEPMVCVTLLGAKSVQCALTD